jgi:putative ABC transport system substrate-binding protein
MRRREFIELVGAATTWPFAAHAQKTTIPVIGYLSARSAGTETALRTPFLKALAEGGFVAGRDVLVEYRFAEGHEDQLQGLAADLVRRPVSMLVAAERPSQKRQPSRGKRYRCPYLHNPTGTQAAKSCS